MEHVNVFIDIGCTWNSDKELDCIFVAVER